MGWNTSSVNFWKYFHKYPNFTPTVCNSMHQFKEGTLIMCQFYRLTILIQYIWQHQKMLNIIVHNFMIKALKFQLATFFDPSFPTVTPTQCSSKTIITYCFEITKVSLRCIEWLRPHRSIFCPLLAISHYKIKKDTNKKTKDVADILEKCINSIHKYTNFFFLTHNLSQFKTQKIGVMLYAGSFTVHTL